MKLSQQVADEYERYYEMWVRILEHQKLLMDLKEALEFTSRHVGILAVEVGTYQQALKLDSLSNTEPCLSRQYKHVRIALDTLRQACAPLNSALGAMELPSEHLLDGCDLFGGAILCGAQAFWIGTFLSVCELGTPREPASKLSIYSVMVRVGKQLGLGYDSQTKLLAPKMIPRYETLRKDVQLRKRGTLEKELKEAFQTQLRADGETLIKALPLVDRMLRELGTGTEPLGWILCGMLPRPDEEDDDD